MVKASAPTLSDLVARVADTGSELTVTALRQMRDTSSPHNHELNSSTESCETIVQCDDKNFNPNPDVDELSRIIFEMVLPSCSNFNSCKAKLDVTKYADKIDLLCDALKDIKYLISTIGRPRSYLVLFIVPLKCAKIRVKTLTEFLLCQEVCKQVRSPLLAPTSQAHRMVSFLPYYLFMSSDKLSLKEEDLLRRAPTSRPIIWLASAAVARNCELAKTHPEMIVALSTPPNINFIPAIGRLIPHAIRFHVVFSLQPIAAVNHNKFLSVLLLLILNATETTEIPIAAVPTMFRVQPTFLELQQLIAGAIWERNQEILNFMMTNFGVSDLGSQLKTSFKINITLGADGLMVKASAPTLSDLVARVADTGSELTVTALGELGVEKT
ncbi:hypothetical protein DAPPUDRAFT_254147 [Daphnia pulex]|uniref:Vitellogenin domain-containing protein n=1 Tax=Daphnia pulex TaxID=6669 RepID=E9H6D9_DAPPU|nr:hypothetical protein DAPPUDRAFT_254147 [Daphnia pulex]|eukprot:EFX72639.1 hypothetical protein DAPPUDRAFT_254147 [Daphnia pulex]